MTARPAHPASPDDAPEPLGAGTLRLAPGVDIPAGALAWSFSRSGGPGGQNVNKVNTKAELRVALHVLPISPPARQRIAALAGSRLLPESGGTLVIVSQSERSQQANKAECLERLRELILRAMVIPKVRRATKPTRGSKQRRLTEKKSRGEIKRNRQGGGHD